MDGELKYIFIQIKIIFISTELFFFYYKIFQFAHSCHAKQAGTEDIGGVYE